jgi:hypothetical protein
LHSFEAGHDSGEGQSIISTAAGFRECRGSVPF